MTRLAYMDGDRRWDPQNDSIRFTASNDGKAHTFYASAEALEMAGGLDYAPSGDEAEAIFDEHSGRFLNAALRLWRMNHNATGYLITDKILEEFGGPVS